MNESPRAVPAAPPNTAPLERENQRLQMLVSELIKDNQELRFKNATLEEQAMNLGRGLNNSTAWAGMLF